jgi:hypothetical protein
VTVLREIKNRYVGPRVFRAAITTTSAPTISAGVGNDDYTSLTRSGTGRFQATLKQPFRRTPITVAAIESATLFGAAVWQRAIPTTSVVDMQMGTAASTAADATTHFLQLGYNSTQLGFSYPQNVEASIRRSRIIYARVASGGTIDFGRGDVTVSKTGTGLYDVTFRNAFAVTPLIVPIAISTTGAFSAAVRAKSAASCTIATGNGSGSAADCAFYIVVVGQDIRDAHGGANAIIESTQRRPRLVGFRVTGVSVTVNPEEVSSVGTNGTGDFTLNLSRPFARECAALISPITTSGNCIKIQVHTGGSSSVRIYCTDTGGGAASGVDGYDAILIGSDDVSEY